MDIIVFIFDVFIHIDENLIAIIDKFGIFTYLILFLVIFSETGFVITPFLPGDSLLFAAGTFATNGVLNPFILFLLLTLAAILGDTVNYWIGNYFGVRIFRNDNSRFFKKAYLERTHAFYEKHGGKTIILARFIPIIRTFAPFVAGVGKMSYPRFLVYNVLGGALWVGIFIFAGLIFGSLDVVKDNFSLVIIAIIFISVLPWVIEYLRRLRQISASNGKVRKND